MNAIRQGIKPPVQGSPVTRLATAATYDADVFRALLETVQCLALPQEVLQRPGMMDKVDRYARSEPPSVPGPDREQLLSLLA
jgi:hypothetical protein